MHKVSHILHGEGQLYHLPFVFYFMDVACCKMWKVQAKAKTQLSGCASAASSYWKHHWSAVSVCVPNVLRQAQVSWRWKQSCRCIHLFCFVYFDNIPFLYWQHSHMSLPINLHLKAGESIGRKVARKNLSSQAAFLEERDKVQRGQKEVANSNLRTVGFSSEEIFHPMIFFYGINLSISSEVRVMEQRELWHHVSGNMASPCSLGVVGSVTWGCLWHVFPSLPSLQQELEMELGQSYI